MSSAREYATIVRGKAKKTLALAVYNIRSKSLEITSVEDGRTLNLHTSAKNLHPECREEEEVEEGVYRTLNCLRNIEVLKDREFMMQCFRELGKRKFQRVSKLVRSLGGCSGVDIVRLNKISEVEELQSIWNRDPEKSKTFVSILDKDLEDQDYDKIYQAIKGLTDGQFLRVLNHYTRRNKTRELLIDLFKTKKK